jgi:hypothetical protein
MNDKQFYIIALQLVEVLCARGAIKGESVDELKEDKPVDKEES